MDDLIQQIQDKTELSRDKVLEVVTVVTDFMKEKMPDELIEKVSGYLDDAGEMTTSVAGSAAGKATGAATAAKDVAVDATGKVVGGATSAFSKATDAVTDVINSNNDEA